MYNEVRIKSEHIEKLENMINYYGYHGVENMIVKHPGFVQDDFQSLLNIVAEIVSYKNRI